MNNDKVREAYMDEIDAECPYCDGEGWVEDDCDCMEGCVACVAPSGMPCAHCGVK